MQEKPPESERLTRKQSYLETVYQFGVDCGIAYAKEMGIPFEPATFAERIGWDDKTIKSLEHLISLPQDECHRIIEGEKKMALEVLLIYIRQHYRPSDQQPILDAHQQSLLDTAKNYLSGIMVGTKRVEAERKATEHLAFGVQVINYCSEQFWKKTYVKACQIWERTLKYEMKETCMLQNESQMPITSLPHPFYKQQNLNQQGPSHIGFNNQMMHSESAGASKKATSTKQGQNKNFSFFAGATEENMNQFISTCNIHSEGGNQLAARKQENAAKDEMMKRRQNDYLAKRRNLENISEMLSKRQKSSENVGIPKFIINPIIKSKETFLVQIFVTEGNEQKRTIIQLIEIGVVALREALMKMTGQKCDNGIEVAMSSKYKRAVNDIMVNCWDSGSKFELDISRPNMPWLLIPIYDDL